MESLTNGQRQSRITVLICTALAALLLTPLISSSQTSADEAATPQMQQLTKYPLKDFGELFTRLQKELIFPPQRSDSHLLPLFPQSTVFYVTFPNYGATAQQALKIFREERQSRPALRQWWQSG